MLFGGLEGYPCYATSRKGETYTPSPDDLNSRNPRARNTNRIIAAAAQLERCDPLTTDIALRSDVEGEAAAGAGQPRTEGVPGHTLLL